MKEMTPEFDPRIAAWLEEDPDQAPSIVIDTVVGALPSIPQRRGLRPLLGFDELFRFAVAAAILIVAALGVGAWLGRNANPGGVSPSTAAPTATTPPIPSPTPHLPASGFESITSPLHGWTAEIPATWRLRPATEVWPPNTYPLAGAAYTDNSEPEINSTGFPAFDVNVRDLEPGETPEDFIAFISAGNEEAGQRVVEESETVVDGETGRLQRQSAQFYESWEVIVVHDGRAYAIYWVDSEALFEQRSDIFNQILSSFEFPS
jgi:hypothetical protein